jgi:NTE family protein
MITSLVLSAGGMFGAWEVGAWRVLSEVVRPDLIVGASAGAWIGWNIGGGVPLDDLERQWLNPEIAGILRFAPHARGLMRPDALFRAAQEMFERSRPVVPFALTLVEVPNLRLHIIRDREITWKHLAATAAIPFCFPPVEIDGKRYVDGGFRGALPLWAAAELGATSAIALNVLNGLPWRVLRKFMRGRSPATPLETTCLEPSTPLGSVRDAVVWSERNIRRWIALGEHDAKRAVTSIRM